MDYKIPMKRYIILKKRIMTLKMVDCLQKYSNCFNKDMKY